MREDNGRFLRKANPCKVAFSGDVLSIDQYPIIRKTKGKFAIQADNEFLQAREGSMAKGILYNRLEAIVRLLDEGRQAEALFTASFMSWPALNKNESETDAKKWQFNPQQPRDDHGRWTDGDAATGSSALIDVQYRGHFHDVVVDDLLQGLESGGSTVLKNVRVLGLNMIMAIPDGASRPNGWALPYFIEVKTGGDPKFTINQDQVYPLICLGGHATSFDTRISQLGLTPGAPFPPLDIMLAYTEGPGRPLLYYPYCDLLALGNVAMLLDAVAAKTLAALMVLSMINADGLKPHLPLHVEDDGDSWLVKSTPFTDTRRGLQFCMFYVFIRKDSAEVVGMDFAGRRILSEEQKAYWKKFMTPDQYASVFGPLRHFERNGIRDIIFAAYGGLINKPQDAVDYATVLMQTKPGWRRSRKTICTPWKWTRPKTRSGM